MSCKDCEEIPPVSADYTEKGTYETIAGIKTYITGPSTAKRAAIIIYDVFGPAPQTLQGADRLAQLLGDTLVFVPDFLQGHYIQESWLPPDTPEKQKAFTEFRNGPAALEPNVEALLRLRKEVGEKWPAVDEHVAVGGLCWGGKVSVVACKKGDNEGKGRRFNVIWTAHPGRLDAADAEVANVPYLVLASPGEDAEEVAKVKAVLEKPGKTGYVETYGPPMFHGWMGGRANLKDETNRKEYERGYKQVADYVAKYI